MYFCAGSSWRTHPPPTVQKYLSTFVIWEKIQTPTPKKVLLYTISGIFVQNFRNFSKKNLKKFKYCKNSNKFQKNFQEFFRKNWKFFRFVFKFGLFFCNFSRILTKICVEKYLFTPDTPLLYKSTIYTFVFWEKMKTPTPGCTKVPFILLCFRPFKFKFKFNKCLQCNYYIISLFIK